MLSLSLFLAASLFTVSPPDKVEPHVKSNSKQESSNLPPVECCHTHRIYYTCQGITNTVFYKESTACVTNPDRSTACATAAVIAKDAATQLPNVCPPPPPPPTKPPVVTR